VFQHSGSPRSPSAFCRSDRTAIGHVVEKLIGGERKDAGAVIRGRACVGRASAPGGAVSDGAEMATVGVSPT
jgi:hypothetical protein